VEEEMATKTKMAKKSKTYKVSYKGAVKAIKLLEKRLTAIKSKVSEKSKSEIASELEIIKKAEMFCVGSGRMKMSKTYV
jgi:hypothetical protein